MVDKSSTGLRGMINKSLVQLLSYPTARYNVLVTTQTINLSIPPESRKSGSMLNLLWKLIREQGVLRLYDGLPLKLLMGVVTSETYKRVESLKSKLSSSKEKPSLVHTIVSKILLGTAVMAFFYPLDVLQTVASANVSENPPSLKETATKIYENRGISGFFTGFGSSIIGIFVYRASFFGFYDTLRSLIPNEDSSAKWLLAQGVTILAGLVAYPINTIRNRMIIQAVDEKPQYENIVGGLVKIIKEEGFTAPFAGAGVRILLGILTSSLPALYGSLKQGNPRQEQKNGTSA